MRDIQSGLLITLIALILILQGQACSQKRFTSIENKVNHAAGLNTPDTYFGYQWFLGGKTVSSSVDIGASKVWSAGNLGQDIQIAVVDPSSIYLSHTDLSDNKDLTKSFNFLLRSSGTDTTLDGAESHGTCVAGIIAARELNGEGIRGISSRARISARTTSGSDVDLYDALTYKASETEVSSNSYGPPDNLAELNQYYISNLFNQGIETGITTGRGGLGTVYVWAAGNGRQNSDRSNYDGYSSHRGVMSVCSVGTSGNVSFFSEPGANLWVCAPGEKIPATDYLGLNCADGSDFGSDLSNAEYTKNFTGTSASTPVVAGVVGLILREAKLKGKNLGWRDVKMIVAESATKPSSVTWQPSRLKFNDDMGFGIINANAAVALVNTWNPVGNASWLVKTLGASLLGPTSSASLDDSTGTFLSMKSFRIDNTLVENGSTIFNSNINYLEYITLELKLSHTDPGDLEVSLVKTALSGGTPITSKIVTPHNCLDGADQIKACATASNYLYEFGVSNFLGESAEGVWELKIRDARANGKTGSVTGWRLKLYGH